MEESYQRRESEKFGFVRTGYNLADELMKDSKSPLLANIIRNREIRLLIDQWIDQK